MSAELVRPARGFVPFGAPVLAADDSCAATSDLTRMIGVARRCGDPGQGYEDGSDVRILTEGGILMRIAETAELEIRGVTVRLLAADPHYVELHKGRVVAFLGDGALA
jgi:hypothetical protein